MMTILRVVLSLLIPTVLLVEGFTSNKRSKEGIAFAKPEHLRYANLEKSSLFTNPMEKQQFLERIQVQLQSSLKSNNHPQATSSVPSSSSAATTTPRRSSSSSKKGLQPSQPSSVNNRHASKDWLYNLKSLPKSSVLREIRNPVLTAAGWSTIISIVHRICTMSSNPMLKSMATNMSVPHSAHSFLVSSLGLLLVFRTNSAYQRFLEGRRIWENILSVSRNLSRMVTLYERDLGSDRVVRIKNLLAAYPYLLRHHIRSGCLCHKEDSAIEDKYRLVLQEPSAQVVDARYEGDKTSGGAYQPPTVSQTRTCWVDRRDLPWSLLDQDNSRHGGGSASSTLLKVAQSQNRPLWVCDRLGREIMDVAYNPNYTSRERLAFLGSIDKLTNAIGECERIHQTAVPLNYARHSLRSLTIWLFTLPFALVKDLGLLTGPATAVTAWVLFGVYQIGHSIEDPFQGSLRLSMLCDAIRRDILGDNVGQRASAFDVEQANDEGDLWDSEVATSPFLFPTSVKKQKDLETILSSKLVQENGTWTFVGA